MGTSISGSRRVHTQTIRRAIPYGRTYDFGKKLSCSICPTKWYCKGLIVATIMRLFINGVKISLPDSRKQRGRSWCDRNRKMAFRPWTAGTRLRIYPRLFDSMSYPHSYSSFRVQEAVRAHKNFVFSSLGTFAHNMREFDMDKQVVLLTFNMDVLATFICCYILARWWPGCYGVCEGRWCH